MLKTLTVVDGFVASSVLLSFIELQILYKCNYSDNSIERKTLKSFLKVSLLN